MALYAPGATFAGVELYPDLVTKARVLVVHPLKNHPLLDGNKRAAYLAMLEFLAATSADSSPLAWTAPST